SIARLIVWCRVLVFYPLLFPGVYYSYCYILYNSPASHHVEPWHLKPFVRSYQVSTNNTSRSNTNRICTASALQPSTPSLTDEGCAGRSHPRYPTGEPRSITLSATTHLQLSAGVYWAPFHRHPHRRLSLVATPTLSNATTLVSSTPLYLL